MFKRIVEDIFKPASEKEVSLRQKDYYEYDIYIGDRFGGTFHNREEALEIAKSMGNTPPVEVYKCGLPGERTFTWDSQKKLIWSSSGKIDEDIFKPATDKDIEDRIGELVKTNPAGSVIKGLERLLKKQGYMTYSEIGSDIDSAFMGIFYKQENVASVYVERAYRDKKYRVEYSWRKPAKETYASSRGATGNRSERITFDHLPTPDELLPKVIEVIEVGKKNMELKESFSSPSERVRSIVEDVFKPATPEDLKQRETVSVEKAKKQVDIISLGDYYSYGYRTEDKEYHSLGRIMPWNDYDNDYKIVPKDGIRVTCDISAAQGNKEFGGDELDKAKQWATRNVIAYLTNIYINEDIFKPTTPEDRNARREEYANTVDISFEVDDYDRQDLLRFLSLDDSYTEDDIEQAWHFGYDGRVLGHLIVFKTGKPFISGPEGLHKYVKDEKEGVKLAEKAVRNLIRTREHIRPGIDDIGQIHEDVFKPATSKEVYRRNTERIAGYVFKITERIKIAKELLIKLNNVDITDEDLSVRVPARALQGNLKYHLESAIKGAEDHIKSSGYAYNGSPMVLPSILPTLEMFDSRLKNRIYSTKAFIENPTASPFMLSDPDPDALYEGNEKEQYFIERTHKHIGLVKKAAEKIVKAYPELSKLTQQVKNHDSSKLVDPEKTPYIDISWRHKEDNFKSYKKPGTLDKDSENKATLHHITTNSHHPEYHLANKEDANINKDDRDKSDKCVDASRMPDIDVAEMVADWQAMSEELKTNSAREWYNQQKDKRWHFSKEQDELIDKLLKVFEGGFKLQVEDIFKPADRQEILNRKEQGKQELEKEKAEYEKRYPAGSKVVLKVMGSDQKAFDFPERFGTIGFWFVGRTSNMSMDLGVYMDVTWDEPPMAANISPTRQTSIQLDNVKWYLDTKQMTITPPIKEDVFKPASPEDVAGRRAEMDKERKGRTDKIKEIFASAKKGDTFRLYMPSSYWEGLVNKVTPDGVYVQYELLNKGQWGNPSLQTYESIEAMVKPEDIQIIPTGSSDLPPDRRLGKRWNYMQSPDDTYNLERWVGDRR